MATATASIPIANRRVHTANQPTVAAVLDTNHPKYIASFDPSTENRLHFTWWLPANYFSGNLTMKLYWRANATSGDCVWKTNYVFFASTNSTNFTNNTATTTTTTSGTANNLNVTSITLSSGVAASRLLGFSVVRDAANAADTLSVAADLEQIVFEYTSDGTTAREYLWVPANAFVIPPGSGVTLTSYTSSNPSGLCEPYALSFPDAASAKASFHLNLPSTYAGDPKVTLVIQTAALGGTTVAFFEDASTTGVGTLADQSLTAGSTFNISTGSSSKIVFDSARALPVTPAASDELTVSLRRDNSDAATGAVNVVGVLLEFAISSSAPAPTRLDPTSGVLPAAAATFIQLDETNTSRYACQYADGSTQSAAYVGQVPGIYLSGGTLRVRWYASPASGNARLRADYASPAAGTASDPAMTTGTAADFATSGALLINESTFDISPGMAANDLLHILLSREGGHANDTLAGVVNVIQITAEVSVTN